MPVVGGHVVNPGETVTGITQDGSVAGTVDYYLSTGIVEFDA